MRSVRWSGRPGPGTLREAAGSGAYEVMQLAVAVTRAELRRDALSPGGDGGN